MCTGEFFKDLLKCQDSEIRTGCNYTGGLKTRKDLFSNCTRIKIYFVHESDCEQNMTLMSSVIFGFDVLVLMYAIRRCSEKENKRLQMAVT